jgi:RNA 3'-phosphate cyclase
MVVIDASWGEGGGQVLRSALTLALLTGRALRLEHVREARPRPGLAPQHLTAVKAAARVGAAQVEGAALGSTDLTFRPAGLHPGRYRFDIGTAGSTGLLLQTLLPALALAPGPSEVVAVGGTHVPWSPCFELLDRAWRPLLARCGLRLDLRLVRPGFYPRGGGEVHAGVRPGAGVTGLRLTERGPLEAIEGVSAVANLPLSIAERQRSRALQGLARLGLEADIALVRSTPPSTGTYLALTARCAGVSACFCALGARGKRAERVADEAVQDLAAFLRRGAAVERHLADQVLLPLALAGGGSAFTTSEVTAHLTTNAWVIRQFLPVHIAIEGNTGEPGRVVVG